MARSVKEIKKSMTDQFIADSVIREKYGLTVGDTFDSAFSLVSIENILFGIVAMAIYVLEGLFDGFKSYIDRQVAAGSAATIPWYHKACLNYQHGDTLILDEDTLIYSYAAQDSSKQVVKYAACRDKGAYIYMLVSGEDNGFPVALSDDVLIPFRSYMNTLKPAGVQVEIHSYNPDTVKIHMVIQRDSLVMNSDGALIDNTSTYPVEDAVNAYLNSIEFGGVFNKTRLADAIQQAAGVLDVRIDSVEMRAITSEEFSTIDGNSYESVGGAFTATDLRSTVRYETVQI